MPDTVIVVPCYNEANRLQTEEFIQFAEHTDNIQIYFIDDGSIDGTPARLEFLQAKYPAKFKVITLEKNQGKGEAVRRGLLAAIDNNADFVGYWDADLSTPLGEVPAFLEVFKEKPQVEIIFGARVKLLGREVRRKASRHYVGRFSATLISWVTGMAVYDTQCGAKLFRKTSTLAGILQEPFLSRWLFDVEIMLRLIRTLKNSGSQEPEQAFYEIPLKEWIHRGDSKLKLWDYFLAMSDLFRIYRRYK